MKLKYTAAWVGVTAAAMFAVSACGAESVKSESVKQTADAVDKTDTVMAALARATDRTEQVGSAEVKMITDMGTGTPITMDGTYSWGDGPAYDVQMDTKASQMQTLQDDPTLRALFVDGAYYYDIDPQPSGPLAGKEWMKIDGSAVFGEAGAEAFNNSNSSPSASMKALKYANDVENLGTETVNGKRATHYRAVIDQAHMGRYKDALGEDAGVLGSVTGGVDEIAMDVWVGDRDLPVRLVQEMGAMKVTVDFEKFGDTTEVKAPPAAQTGDLTEAIKEQAGAAQ
ncbi:hypothetical protein [Streptomyces aurantiogriseus]|uniref:Lipoprotein n=1 Tax=Streptomyces aurantiogriseus TaxID=66870 RepID=A0A918KXX8_9ACTN|nr:hypothetical protein [Streptomyces aurantiogriseus]GGR43649.1 putative lipoprotein [Streptomyces aurantiogriseus]